ncbi:MAG: DUF2242 domain-containing protein [Burkholderiaceae bacterium]|jgi:hypothetical protein
MSLLDQRFRVVAFLAAALLLGCSTPKPFYDQETFATESPYSHHFAAESGATCEAARRALLSQGYVINEAKSDSIDARKSFQQDAETHMEIAFHVVCAGSDKDDKTSTAFVNALQERFAIKKVSSSAGLGVGAVGAISLPFGASDDSMVKVASETIHADTFYDRFFELLNYYLIPGLKVPTNPDDAKKPAPGQPPPPPPHP